MFDNRAARNKPTAAMKVTTKNNRSKKLCLCPRVGEVVEIQVDTVLNGRVIAFEDDDSFTVLLPSIRCGWPELKSPNMREKTIQTLDGKEITVRGQYGSGAVGLTLVS